MKKRFLSLLCVLALCLGLLPVTALAVDAPATLYVGNQQVISGTDTTYWSTNNSGELTQSAENNAWNVKYDPNTVTLTLKNATIKGVYNNVNTSGSGIYAASSSGPVSLNIVLEEENKVSGMYGIDVRSSGGDASLNISGSGSLTVSGLSGNGIGIFMSSQNSANLTIEGASVTASGNQSGGSGVRLITSQTGSPSLTIEVKGGSLQASGETNGIHFLSNVNDATAVANMKVSGNATVKASNIITTKDGTGSAPELKPAASGSDGTGGIIWDGKNGTVYGKVELQEDLTIGEGESLTIPDGASLNTGDYTLTVDGGTLTGNVTGTVNYKVTGVSLNTDSLSLEVGDTATLTATVEPDEASNKNVTWSSDGTSVATVDDTGKVTAISVGSATITATTQDGNKTATCTVTVTAPPEPEPEPTPPPYIPPTYAVATPETTGGTVTVSPSRASSGRTVTITAAPDTGFALESLTVLDSRGNEIALTDKGGGKYTFTMPASRVTVEASFAPAPLPFEDVAPGAWYEEAVRYAYFHNIMEGMRETEFSPTTALTRAMAVQILYNLEGQPDLSSENLGYPYEDVDAQAWHGNAVYWARITGVATGYGDGTFQPGDSITRQEFAQMLYNYAKYKGYDLTAEGDLAQFPDSESVEDWAEAAMRWANGNQLINGHDDGTIDAAGIGTRAQAASILMKFDQNLVEN